MKTQSLLVLTVSLSIFVVAGCKPSNEPSGASDVNDPSVAEQTKAGSAVSPRPSQDSQDYAYTQKAEFIDKMKTEIANLKTQTRDLEAKVESCTGSTKAELQSKLDDLRRKVNDLNNQLESVKAANAGTWTQVKAALQKGTAEAKESFNQARQWLSDKLKP